MSITAESVSVPLRKDEGGAIRVGDSQVLLDAVIREFNNGANPDDIVSDHGTLELADVFAVIAYYLRNREQVDAYLQGRRAEADRLRKEIEAAQPDRDAFREMIRARRVKVMESDHAAPGQ